MMNSRSQTWLTDIVVYGERTLQKTTGLTSDDYVANLDLRDIVERNLLKIGELVVRLRDHDEETVSRLAGFRGLIGLRNILSHDYESLSDEEVFELIQRALPVLIADAREVLDGPSPT